MKKCIICKKDFIPNKYKQQQKLCSKECYIKHQKIESANYRRTHKEQISKSTYSDNKHCNCGKLITNRATQCKSCLMKKRYIVIEKSPTYIHGKFCKCNKNYCSVCKKEISPLAEVCQECYLKTIKGKNHPLYIDNRTNQTYFCSDCGIKISVDNGIKGKGRCHSCSHTGKLNYKWIEDRSLLEYPDEFNNELKNKIKTRDNYICQNCGITQEEHLIVVGRDLHVHHIDYIKEQCNETNLITLCMSCNIRANFNRDYWQEIYRNKIKELCHG